MLLLLLAQAAPAVALSCGGAGTATRSDVATVYGGQNEGNSAWPTMHDRQRQAFSDRVEVRIAGSEGRIRLPAALLPADHDGDGWIALGDLRLRDGAFMAKASINPMNNPRVHIDRDAGTIRIRGWAGSYEGVCEAQASDLRGGKRALPRVALAPAQDEHRDQPER